MIGSVKSAIDYPSATAFPVVELYAGIVLVAFNVHIVNSEIRYIL